MEIKGVAFDLDGTLYPDRRLRKMIIPQILKNLRFVISFGKARTIIRKEQEKWVNTNCIPGDFYLYQAEITGKILKKSNEPPEILKDEIDQRIYKTLEPFFKNVKLYSGVKETLAALKEKGYKLGLLSDFPPETKLKNLELSGIWDAVLCSEQCGVLKPHPLPFLKLAEMMSLPPENILYVGNRHSYDVTGANKIGMKTALIKRGLSFGRKKTPAPDFLFSDYRQFNKFVIPS